MAKRSERVFYSLPYVAHFLGFKFDQVQREVKRGVLRVTSRLEKPGRKPNEERQPMVTAVELERFRQALVRRYLERDSEFYLQIGRRLKSLKVPGLARRSQRRTVAAA